MTQNDNGPSRGRNYGEWLFLRTAEKCFFLAKMGFDLKKTPKTSERTDTYLVKGNFFFEQLFLVVAITWERSGFFWAQNLGFWAKKSNFCHTTPILVNGPFVALGETVHLPPWERFSDFPFKSYSRFRKKKTS